MKSTSVAIQKLPNVSSRENNLDLNPKHSHPLKKKKKRCRTNFLPFFLWTTVCEAGAGKVSEEAPTCVLESPYG